MTNIILKTKDLTKKYNKDVVDDLNIEIQKGEIFGLLGSNGAYKITTMNKNCSIVCPTAGKLSCWARTPGSRKRMSFTKSATFLRSLLV